MPVLPDVLSTMVPPGFSNPARSASSITFTAIRSLIELPGLNVSTFASTVPLTMPRVMRLMRTIGVDPIASRMVSQIFFTAIPLLSRNRCLRKMTGDQRRRRARRHGEREERPELRRRRHARDVETAHARLQVIVEDRTPLAQRERGKETRPGQKRHAREIRFVSRREDDVVDIDGRAVGQRDRKSTRLNSSHVEIS